jgi:hypothetical protein
VTPGPLPRLAPAGTFPPELRFSSEGLAALPPAVEELLASGDCTAALSAMFESAADQQALLSGSDSDDDGGGGGFGPLGGGFGPGRGRWVQMAAAAWEFALGRCRALHTRAAG